MAARPILIAALAAGLAQPVPAQQIGEPLSAIDWLSDSVRTAPEAAPGTLAAPPTEEAPVADSASPPDVTVTPLDRPSPDGVGLLPPSMTGLPDTLWAGSETATLVDLLRATPAQGQPAMLDLLRTLLLSEARPPADAEDGGALFLARVDKLLDLGALDPALTLLEQASPDTAPLFRRYFDVALLTGNENDACDRLADAPDIAPTLSARIFCLARRGDWNAAALTLGVSRSIGDLDPGEEDILTRFLDPELFEGEPVLPPPARPTPLDFRMREAIGEGMGTAGLPRAFAHADLRPNIGWKSRLEAAERLSRAGAIDPSLLWGLYNEQTPAASGGVWDRAAAMQDLAQAILTGRARDVGDTLPAAWEAAEAARIERAFAAAVAGELRALPLTGEAQALAFRIGLLSPDYEDAALSHAPDDAEERFLQAVALGDLSRSEATSARQEAIRAAFTGAEAPAALMAMAAEDRLGEAILRAMALFAAGVEGDDRSLTEALAFFRRVGLEDTARRAALEVLLLDRDP